MGLQKDKYEQISVDYFCGKHAMANRCGAQKKKNEQISVGHFCRKHAMGPKKLGNVAFFFGRSEFFLWPPTDMRSFL